MHWVFIRSISQVWGGGGGMALLGRCEYYFSLLPSSSSSDFWLTCKFRVKSTAVGPLPGSWLAARMADLTSDLQVCLSWGSIAESCHSLQSLSVSNFHVILGLPGPRFPSTCMSKAFLTAPVLGEPLLQNEVQILNAKPAGGSLDLVMTMSCGLTL